LSHVSDTKAITTLTAIGTHAPSRNFGKPEVTKSVSMSTKRLMAGIT